MEVQPSYRYSRHRERSSNGGQFLGGIAGGGLIGLDVALIAGSIPIPCFSHLSIIPSPHVRPGAEGLTTIPRPLHPFTHLAIVVFILF